MGIYYTAKIIVGVPGEFLYKEKVTEGHITKYNENTGKPLKIKVDNYNYYWLGKHTTEDPHELAEEIGLEYILGSYPTGEDPIFGLEIESLDRDGDSLVEIDMEEVQDKINQINKKMDELGVKARARPYLMNQCS